MGVSMVSGRRSAGREHVGDVSKALVASLLQGAPEKARRGNGHARYRPFCARQSGKKRQGHGVKVGRGGQENERLDGCTTRVCRSAMAPCMYTTGLSRSVRRCL